VAMPLRSGLPDVGGCAWSHKWAGVRGVEISLARESSLRLGLAL